jgi:limonene 1,2-monooxygenase
MKFSNENKLKFGIFIGPYHKPGINPTLSFQQDLEIVDQLDRLGFDEAWVGEHHSGGIESIADPMLFIAASAERTKRIKLGTGAVTLPWHHPFQIAERIVQLSHMTRGRVNLGVAPGQIVQDATMMGTDPLKHRAMMDESLSCIVRLLKGEVVTHHADWFVLEEAQLQLLPYNDFDVCVVSGASPNAPYSAGKNGGNMISVAASSPAGMDALAGQWKIMEELYAENGHGKPDRGGWRLLSPMHIAPTLEQAIEEVRFGFSMTEDYRGRIHPQASGPDYYDLENTIKLFNESGGAIVGTPEMAREHIQRLIDKSGGGFGTLLLMGVDWANHDDTLRSHRLFAQEVMPHFDGSLAPMTKSYNKVMSTGFSGAETTAAAQKIAAEQFANRKVHA